MSTRTRPAACCADPIPPAPLPPPERERLVAAFKALADPTRLDVFRLIAAQAAPLCACDVVDRFAVSQPTISHHLKVLREAGLITVSRRGVWAYYAVDPGGLALLRESLDAFAPTLFAAAG
jgi:ArsR family transcriptional regulator, arsenate/arsenite/antimonite-responsive transcriptional repressor